MLNVSPLLIHLLRLWSTAGGWTAQIDFTPSSFVLSLCIRSAFCSLTQWEHSGRSRLSDYFRDISDCISCQNFCRSRHFIWNSLLSQIMLYRIVLPYFPLLFSARQLVQLYALRIVGSQDIDGCKYDCVSKYPEWGSLGTSQLSRRTCVRINGACNRTTTISIQILIWS